MRKFAWLLSLVLLFAAFPVVSATLPTKVTIGAAAKKQPAVQFDHTKHVTRARSCDQCHHDSKGLTAAKGTPRKCTACHLDPKDKAPSMREMSLTRNPFHMRCLGCHKTGKKGPVACAGCHVKK